MEIDLQMYVILSYTSMASSNDICRLTQFKLGYPIVKSIFPNFYVMRVVSWTKGRCAARIVGWRQGCIDAGNV